MSSDKVTQVELVVDGSCLGNPGVGGWAAILNWRGHERELVGGENQSTNNRMELVAVLEGLKALKRTCQVRVVTDSEYVAKVLGGCKAKTNLDLVTQLRQAASQHQILVEVVAGHTGHLMNERCDQLARAEAKRMRVSS